MPASGVTTLRNAIASNRATSRRACGLPRPSATTGFRNKATATSSPESFTHGSSAQRQEWLMRGLKTGDMNQCDTFTGTDFLCA